MKSRFVRLLSSFVLSVLAVFSVSAADAPAVPRVGETAPNVEGKDQDGKTWKLADQAGKSAVLLYFYPKDDTPGCTKEACGFRDSMADLQKSNVQVVGVSFDSAESHKEFIAKHHLNFPLIADTDGKIADAFGVRRADRNVARRVSFLIDRNGKIVHVTDSGNAEAHVTEMKEAAGKLTKG